MVLLIFSDQARKSLQKIFQGVVDERRLGKLVHKKEEKKDMLDVLMGNEDENGGKLSDEEIVDLIIMFLNAGHESSGHAAMWAVVLLQDHPEVFQKAKVSMLINHSTSVFTKVPNSHFKSMLRNYYCKSNLNTS